MSSIVHITIGEVGAVRGTLMPAIKTTPKVTGQTLTSTGLNQKTVSAAVPAGSADGKAVWVVSVGSLGDKDIYVAFGPTGTVDAANVAQRHLCQVGTTREFFTENEGDVAAIIEA